MYKITSLFAFALFAISSLTSMEYNVTFDLKALPEDVSIGVIASCENKNALRQTCKHFVVLASRRKNETILVQPQLYLNKEALDRYLLYYGALGNTAIVRNLLARGANPNACEDNGMTLMHHAMRCGYDDIENMLLEHPALIKNDTIESNSFASLQCNQSSIDRMCPLCVLKADKLIFNAIEKGSYSAVEYFLSRNVSANVVNKKGESALYCAAQAGYLNIMKLLIRKGAHVNGVSFYDKQGYYKYFVPLQGASQKGHTSAVQLLIDHNVDVNKYDDWHICWDICERGYVHIFKIILAQKVDMIKYLGLLHTAAFKGHTQIVQTLLENGADVNATRYVDNGYKKPLDVASNDEIKALLIEYGAMESGQCAMQ
jgi:ankyrin repeat protein